MLQKLFRVAIAGIQRLVQCVFPSWLGAAFTFGFIVAVALLYLYSLFDPPFVSSVPECRCSALRCAGM